MKLLLVCMSMCCMLLVGCRSVNTVDRETYEALITYRDTIGRGFNNYMENDRNITPREKNVYKTYERYYDIAIMNLKVEY